jgi:hypothetical protein
VGELSAGVIVREVTEDGLVARVVVVIVIEGDELAAAGKVVVVQLAGVEVGERDVWEVGETSDVMESGGTEVT